MFDIIILMEHQLIWTELNCHRNESKRGLKRIWLMKATVFVRKFGELNIKTSLIEQDDSTFVLYFFSQFFHFQNEAFTDHYIIRILSSIRIFSDLLNKTQYSR